MSVENIYQQIKGQSQNLGTAKTFQTGAAGTKEGGLGSVDAVMRDMAKRLSDAGLTSIEQLGQGQIPVYQKASVYPETRMGKYLRTDSVDMGGDNHYVPIYEWIPTGRWFSQTSYDDPELGRQVSHPTIISDSEVNRLGLSGTAQQNVDLIVGQKTGYINKSTGQPLTSLTGYRGAGWGGTGAGDGQTIYNVQFDPTTGLPIFVNQQRHGKDDYADLLKIAAIGTAIFAPQIGAALLPAGSSAAAALAVGSAVSGFIGSGGSLEAGIKAGLAGYLGGQAGSWASKAANSAFVGSIASNMTRTAILGGDMEQALVASLVQGAPAIISQNFPNFAQLPRAAQEAAVAATVDLMRTGGDNLGQIALQGATKGATDYALGQIDGYKDLRPAQQEIVRARLSNVLGGESLSNELLQGAIQMGSESVQNEVNNDRAKKDGWADYATQQAAQSLYGSKVTPDLYADKQETTEDEAKQIARGILGREPTEFEYMQLIGLPEQEATQNSDLAAIKYDEDTFDSNELAESYKAVWGKEPTAEWLASDEAFDMLGRSEAQGKNMLQNAYVKEQNEIIKDKNWVTEDEAQQFWKAAGNKGEMPQDLMDNMLVSSEAASRAMAETYRIRAEDTAATTFDGSKYDTAEEAKAAAIKAGYNSFTNPVSGKTQIIMPEDEGLKRSQLIRQVLDGQGLTPTTATAEQRQQAINLVSGIPQNKLDSTNVVDLMADAGIAGGSYVKLESNLKYYLTAPPAPSAPKAFDGTRYSTQTDAAIAAASRGQNTFAWTDGKTYKVPTQIAEDGKSGALRDKAFASDLVSLANAYARGEISNKEYKFLEAGVKKQTEAVNKLVANRDLKSAQEAAGQTVGWANLGVESKQTISMLDRAADRVLSLGEGALGFVAYLGQTAAALTVNPQGEGDMYTGFVENVPKYYMDVNNNWATSNAREGQKYIESRYSDQAKTERANIRKEVERPGATEASVTAVMLNNLHGASTFTGAELTEEIIPFLVGGGISAALKLGKAGLVALTGSAATIGDMSEVYGPSYAKAMDDSIKRGDDPATAHALASRVASGNTLITFVTEGPLNFMLAKSLLVDVAKNTAYKVGGNIAAQMAGDYIGTMGQKANEYYVMNDKAPTLDEANNWRGEATFGALIAGGTTSSMYVLAAANPSKVIGKDYDGNDFTVADAITKPSQFDAKTLDSSAMVTDPTTGKTGSFIDVFGDATTKYAGGYSTAITESVISKNPSQSLQIMQDMGLANWTTSGVVTFSPDAGNIATAFISNNTVLPQSNGTYTPTFDVMSLPDVKAAHDHVSNLLEDIGYKPTDQEVKQLVSQNPDVQKISSEQIAEYVAPRMVTEQEAKDAYAALGLDEPTQADIDKLIGQYQQEELAGRAEENLGTAQFNVTAAKQEAAAKALSDLEAKTTEQYNSLTTEQKALADALTAQGTTLTDAIAAAQEQTQTQIGELTADVQAKYDALTAEQKTLANQLQQQGVDLTTAIETAQQQNQQQITDLGVEVDARINELMQQGQTYQQATQTAFAEVNAKNQEMAGLIGTQGRTANQTDIDALTEMLGGQRSMDLAYDVTGDKQITQADIDFLTQVIGGVKTDWTAPQQSPWAATGLYGQIQANELRRQQDLAAAEAKRQADQQAAAQAAAERDRQANIRTTATRAQTSAQGIMQQLEAMQRAGMAPQQPAQLVEAGPGFDVSAALNTGFFSGFQAKKAQQNQQPTTKIAAGGYIDDLLAENMTADDLLNLLR